MDINAVRDAQPGEDNTLPKEGLAPVFETPLGALYSCKAEDFLKDEASARLRGKVQLILTSPPFPLNRKKKYGNLKGDDYKHWLAEFAPKLRELLTDDGSVVMELGNGWEQGQPVMSTLPLEALLEFKKRGNLYLCQQFVHYNPARLPSPAQWVNKERVRVKDAFTNLWWLSATPQPKADNRAVLGEYSQAMKNLISRGTYNSGMRPSGHKIGKSSFACDNGGAVPSNVLIAANTTSTDPYTEFCKKENISLHPARMNQSVVEFFVRFLTTKGDMVFDPFAGSNTSGYIADKLERRWTAVEAQKDYITGAKARFVG